LRGVPVDGERTGFILVFYAVCSAHTSISRKTSTQDVDPQTKCYTPPCKADKKRGKGVPSMGTGNEAAAAILVQTIFLKDGHLQGLLGEQATKSPAAAAEFLQPFYRAVLAMVSKTKVEDK
jgi:hypothetical protein